MTAHGLTTRGPADSASLGAFATALLDPAAALPAGLTAWNASDPAARFAVYRNNVMHSLVTVLGDTFTTVRAMVGDAFFTAMASRFVIAHAPTSPLMHRYGEAFACWLADFEPIAGLPYLPDLARLEFARLTALHAADAAPVDAAALSGLLQAPEQIARATLALDPSLTTLHSSHPVVSLWHAHQFDEAERDAALAALDLTISESALIFRVDDDVLVLPTSPADGALASALAAGTPLGIAHATHPHADLTRVMTALLQHHLVTGLWTPPA